MASFSDTECMIDNDDDNDDDILPKNMPQKTKNCSSPWSQSGGGIALL